MPVSRWTLGEATVQVSAADRERFWLSLTVRYGYRLRAYARKTRCDDDQADDLVRELWALAVSCEDELLACAEPWQKLRCLMARVCAAYIRQVRRDRRIEYRASELAADGCPDRDCSNGEIQEQASWDRVTLAMQSLTARQRDAVILRHLWGWPYWAVAAGLGVHEATARVHVLHGLRKLRTTLCVSTRGREPDAGPVE